MTSIVFSARTLLALIFLFAGLSKLSTFATFAHALPTFTALQEIRLFKLVPATVLARLIIASELVIGAFLLFGVLLAATSGAAALLLGAMTAVLVRNYFGAVAKPCSCFGPNSHPIGAGTLARDVLLLLAAVMVFLRSVGQGFPGYVFHDAFPNSAYVIPSIGMLILGVLTSWLLGSLDVRGPAKPSAREPPTAALTQSDGRLV